MLRVQAGVPAFVGERRIGDDIVEGVEGVALQKQGAHQRVALPDLGRGVVVQDHVHARQAGRGVVLFLPVERDADVAPVRRRLRHLQQQRP